MGDRDCYATRRKYTRTRHTAACYSFASTRGLLGHAIPLATSTSTVHLEGMEHSAAAPTICVTCWTSEPQADWCILADSNSSWLWFCSRACLAKEVTKKQEELPATKVVDVPKTEG